MTTLPPDALAAATLRPNGIAYEAAGELVFYGIPGMTMWLRRTLQSAVVRVRHNGRPVGSGQIKRLGSDAIQSAAGELWHGALSIEGMSYAVGAIRDERAREWRVKLTLPAEAAA